STRRSHQRPRGIFARLRAEEAEDSHPPPTPKPYSARVRRRIRLGHMQTPIPRQKSWKGYYASTGTLSHLLAKIKAELRLRYHHGKAGDVNPELAIYHKLAPWNRRRCHPWTDEKLWRVITKLDDEIFHEVAPDLAKEFMRDEVFNQFAENATSPGVA